MAALESSTEQAASGLGPGRARHRRTLLIIALTATAAAATAGIGLAQMPADSEPSAEVLSKARLTEPFTVGTKGPSDVFIIGATFLPGTDGGWHSHPGPGFFVVTKGTATLYKGDDVHCTPHRIEAGTGLLEPGDTHLVRNEGTEPLEIYSIPIVPADAGSGDEAPNPGHCPF